MLEQPRRLELTELGAVSDQVAAHVLDQAGSVVAVVAEPLLVPVADTFRDAIALAVLSEDFGEVVLAGVVFAPQWGGDAIGFT